MKRLSSWAIFSVLFAAFFVLCAIVLVRFPMAIEWHIDTFDGTSPKDIPPLELYIAHFRVNAPYWAFLSVVLAGGGTAVFARITKGKT